MRRGCVLTKLPARSRPKNKTPTGGGTRDRGWNAFGSGSEHRFHNAI
jgi:hypothetical protein